MTEKREKSESIPETEIEEPKFNDLWEGLYLLVLSCEIIIKIRYFLNFLWRKILLNTIAKL